MNLLNGTIKMENQIEKNNRLIAEFMGYIYFEPDVDIDSSDIGGMYEKKNVYSKVPIEVNDYGDQKYFKSFPNPDYKNENNPKWNPDIEKLDWDTLNSGQYLTELKYHESWDELMPVIKKAFESLVGNTEDWTFLIEKRIKDSLLSFDIEQTWMYVAEFAKKYNKK